MNELRRGMGIGGWLTNYKRFQLLPEARRIPLTIGDWEHFESYITERDIRYIASKNFDHIRVGFDQWVLEDIDHPFSYREEIFVLLERFVGWCKKYGVTPILNLHKSLGNDCGVSSPVQLLESEELRHRFIALWEACEARWANNDEVIFELLNETLNVPPEKWNALAGETLQAIRRHNRTRRVIIGSTCWNSPDKLAALRVYEDDPNVIYTFHFYNPFEFTHQRGVLVPYTLYYNREMHYPSPIEPYRDFFRVVNGDPSVYDWTERMNKKALARMLRGAFAFRAAHPDKTLWLGEFGTIRHAPKKSRQRWMRDVIALAQEHGIPYCVWNYLSTPNDGNRFSLVDDDSRRLLFKIP